MKTNAIIRIVLYSIVIALLLGTLGVFLAFDRYAFNNAEISWSSPIVTTGSGEFHQESHEAAGTEPITHIDIEWTAGTITIQPGDTDRIQLSESGNFDTDEAMVYHQYGSKLTIEYQERDVYIGIYSTPSKDLTITVPRDWQGTSISIDAASARLNMNGITVREVELDSASGVAVFDSCTIEDLDIDTASGDVDFSGTLNTLEFEAASAQLRAVLKNVPSRMEVDTLSGDVDITLPVGCGFTATCDTVSGKFSSDFETTRKDKAYVYGDGRCRIVINAMSSDVHIRKGE